MKRAIVISLLISLLFLAFSSSGCKAPKSDGGGSDKEPDAANSELGKVVDFSIKTVDGKTLTPLDFRGKVLMVDYWATWCSPCRKEFPHFEKLLETYGDDLVIIAISADAKRPVLDNFLKENPLPFIIGLFAESTTPSWHEVNNLPEAFIIDRDGVLRANLKGGHKFEDFDKHIKPLIDAKATASAPVSEAPATDKIDESGNSQTETGTPPG